MQWVFSWYSFFYCYYIVYYIYSSYPYILTWANSEIKGEDKMLKLSHATHKNKEKRYEQSIRILLYNPSQFLFLLMPKRGRDEMSNDNSIFAKGERYWKYKIYGIKEILKLSFKVVSKSIKEILNWKWYQNYWTY